MKSSNREDNYLTAFGVIVFVAPVVDALNYRLVGIPGEGVHLLLLIGNTFIYTAYLLMCYLWIVFLGLHIRGGAGRLGSFPSGPLRSWP